MPENATTQRKGTQYTPNDYLKGRVRLPPEIYGKPKDTFVYGDDIAIANGATGVLAIPIADDSHFLAEAVQIISSLQNNSQDLATVQITESGSGRSWSNKPVPLRDLAGRGDVCKYLSCPNILRPASTLYVQITNNTGGQAQFYVALVGRKIFDVTKDQASFMARRQWFQYVLNVPALAAAAAEKLFTVQVEDKADFLCHSILGSQLIGAVVGGAAGAESSEVMFNLRNKSTGNSLFVKKLAARLLVGQLAGEFFVPNAGQSFSPGAAFKLVNPWPLRRNTLIEGVFDNRGAADTGNFNLVLEGIKTFDA
jgi:hypothetical protein